MQRTAARLVKYSGIAITELPTAFQSTVSTASTSIEQEYPKVTDAKIQGTTPHQSSKDPSDTKNVVTVSYHTLSGTRVLSIHAHDDGTWSVFPSRNASKGK